MTRPFIAYLLTYAVVHHLAAAVLQTAVWCGAGFNPVGIPGAAGLVADSVGLAVAIQRWRADRKAAQ